MLFVFVAGSVFGGLIVIVVGLTIQSASDMVSKPRSAATSYPPTRESGPRRTLMTPEQWHESRYGDHHQRERAKYKAIIAAYGGICMEHECVHGSRRIAPGAPWHLAHDHQRGGARDYLGPAHPECNEVEAIQRGVTFRTAAASHGERHATGPARRTPSGGGYPGFSRAEWVPSRSDRTTVTERLLDAVDVLDVAWDETPDGHVCMEVRLWRTETIALDWGTTGSNVNGTSVNFAGVDHVVQYVIDELGKSLLEWISVTDQDEAEAEALYLHLLHEGWVKE